MRKSFILLFIGFILCYAGHGQTQQTGTRIDQLQKLIPPSPTAAALGKYGDIPVGFYTGTPQISIPIYTLKEGDIQVPISLSYFAGGVKVSEIASNVGLQWSLNAGGAITRSVRGFADESNKGYLFRDQRLAPLTIPIPSNLTDSQYMRLEALAYNDQDMEPDLFVYNFNGRSGKFFFDHTGSIHMVSPEDLKIEFASDFSYWKITDEGGTKYTFAAIEKTTSSNPSNANDVEEVFTSSWYLTNITSKTGRQVNFTYTPHYILQDQLASESDYYSTGPNSILSECYSCPFKNGNSSSRTIAKQEIQSLRLLSIQSPSAAISFFAGSAARLDLDGDTAIERIKVWSNELHQFVKDFHLTYDYFIGNANYGYQNSWILNQSIQNKRLKLVSVEDMAADPGKPAAPLVHRFYYDETVLPPRNSFAQDHWGFYNGANSNATLLPKTSNLPFGISYGDRNSNGAYATAGTLNRIIYPTGGRTDFTYEPNSTQATETTRSSLYQEVYAIDKPAGTETSASFIMADSQYCQLTVEVDLKNNPLGDITPQLIIKDAANHTIVNYTLNTGSSTTSVLFPPGTYTMTLISPDMQHDDLHCRVDYQSGPITQTIIKAVGGLRVKQIADYDSVSQNPIIKKFIYPVNASVFGPQSNDDYTFSNIERAPYNCEPAPPENLQTLFKCYYTGRASSSRSSMGSISGGHIAYDSVTVLYGANGENGKSLHLFGFGFPVGGVGFPYPPAMTYDDRNGLELAQKDYSAAGSLVNESVNTYSYNEQYKELSTKVGFLFDDPYVDALNSGRYVDQITTASFYVLSENARKVSKQIKQYSQDGNGAITGVSQSFYDNPSYTQPTREQKVDSKGDSITEITRFPLDYSVPGTTTGAALGIYNLQQRHLITAPIEKYTVKKLASGTQYVISGSIITYKTSNSLPDKIYTLDISKPILLSQFSPSTIDATYNFQKDSRYIEKIAFNQYDTAGNVLSQSKTADINQSYIWGYHNNYPIAEVLNADTGSIAYTSFETDGNGHWTIGSSSRDTLDGITGSSSYNASSDLSKSSLTASQTYIVSYWTKRASAFTINGTISGYPTKGKTINGWTLFVHKVTGQTTISLTGTGLIDELRLYPADAQMTTYTYSPLIGMTSQCDVGNRITYYEYDGLQRLKRIRDQDYNILKSYDYQYQADAGCGTNCYPIAMQTFNGTATISYPVGVFNVSGKLLGNATDASQYVTLWNADTADNHIGTLSTGSDSMHFNLVLNTGKTLPTSVTGCRYYQIDLAYFQIDAVRNFNAAYIDFGDGTGMRMGVKLTDTPSAVAPNTIYNVGITGYLDQFAEMLYFKHTYSDTTLKTLTFYHNDANEFPEFDNMYGDCISLSRLKNLRGNFPLNMPQIGGSSYQEPTMNSIAGITNWSSLHHLTNFRLNNGDARRPCKNITYPQDFMGGNPDLNYIMTIWENTSGTGADDSTFRLSRLKSDWNTFFKKLKYIRIADNHWNHEDLSGLPNLNTFILYAAQVSNAEIPQGPYVPIPSNVLDSILIQIDQGAGQTLRNGTIGIFAPGTSPTSASAAAIADLKSKGWAIWVNQYL